MKLEFISQMKHENENMKEYFFDDFLLADFWQKTLRLIKNCKNLSLGFDFKLFKINVHDIGGVRNSVVIQKKGF